MHKITRLAKLMTFFSGCLLALSVSTAAWAETVVIESSARAQLPVWLNRPEMLPLYVTRKYFQDDAPCESVRDGIWICHIDCGELCRIDTIFDFDRRFEVTLPQTDANYFYLPYFQSLMSVAFIPSRLGFDLAWVWIDLKTLMVKSIPIASQSHESILNLILSGDRKEGIVGQYCLQSGACFQDRLVIKKDSLLLTEHEKISADAIVPQSDTPQVNSETTSQGQGLETSDKNQSISSLSPPTFEAPVRGTHDLETPILKEDSHDKEHKRRAR